MAHILGRGLGIGAVYDRPRLAPRGHHHAVVELAAAREVAPGQRGQQLALDVAAVEEHDRRAQARAAEPEALGSLALAGRGLRREDGRDQRGRFVDDGAEGASERAPSLAAALRAAGTLAARLVGGLAAAAGLLEDVQERLQGLQALAHRRQFRGPFRVEEGALAGIEAPQPHGAVPARRHVHGRDQPRVVRVRAPPLVAHGEPRASVLAEHVGIDLEPGVGARDLAIEVLRELLDAGARAGLEPHALRLADLADPSVLQGGQQPEHGEERDHRERHGNTRGTRALEHRGRLARAPGRASRETGIFTFFTKTLPPVYAARISLRGTPRSHASRGAPPRPARRLPAWTSLYEGVDSRRLRGIVSCARRRPRRRYAPCNAAADRGAQRMTEQSRREFCTHACQIASMAAMGALLQGCGGGGGGASGTLPTNVPVLGSVAGTSASGAVNVTVDAGSPLAAVGSAAMVQSSSGLFLVTRTGADAFTALTATCTHEQCTISGFTGSEFVCPCHGSRFSTSGAVLNGPATRSLRTFATRFANNVLTISV